MPRRRPGSLYYSGKYKEDVLTRKYRPAPLKSRPDSNLAICYENPKPVSLANRLSFRTPFTHPDLNQSTRADLKFISEGYGRFVTGQRMDLAGEQLEEAWMKEIKRLTQIGKGKGKTVKRGGLLGFRQGDCPQSMGSNVGEFDRRC